MRNIGKRGSVAVLAYVLLAMPTHSFGEGRLSFDAGIGFYWEADGATHFLYWTDDPRKATENDAIAIPENARFYSYGLATLPMPPHLVGYGMHYRTKTGSLEGRYPARFLPVDGYSVPVYEIVLPTGVFADEDYKYFTLTIPQSKAFSESSAYIFRFATEEYKAQQKALSEFVYRALRDNSAWYPGQLERTQIIFDGGTHEFEIRFAQFDESSGELKAEARGLGENRVIKFSGFLTGFRRLVLHHDGSSDPELGELTWELEFDGDGGFFARYREGMGTIHVKISLGTPDQS